MYEYISSHILSYQLTVLAYKTLIGLQDAVTNNVTR